MEVMVRKRIRIEELVDRGGRTESAEEDEETEEAMARKGRSDASVASRKELNLRHSRMSRQKVTRAVEMLVEACREVGPVPSGPQAEVMLSAADLLQSMKQENVMMKTRVDLSGEISRRRTVEEIVRLSWTATESLLTTLDRIISSWQMAIVEGWSLDRNSKVAKCILKRVCQGIDLEDITIFDRNTTNYAPILGRDLPGRLLRDKTDEWIQCKCPGFGRPTAVNEMVHLDTAVGTIFHFHPKGFLGLVFLSTKGLPHDSDFLSSAKRTLETLRRVWQDANIDISTLLDLVCN